MKVVILAGGLGTRLMEETEARPKPMVEIGGKPILWHIMKIYQHHGFNEFVVCLGYKGSFIKDYFFNYFIYNSDFTINLSDNSVEIHRSNLDRFKVTLVDTGLHTNTAGRLKQIKEIVGQETFMLTYGDGVANIDLKRLLKFHYAHGGLATLTSIQTPGRFGSLSILENGEIKNFIEKPDGDGMWINGGFFVLEPGIFKYLEGDMDAIQWEKGPLINIAEDGQLFAFKHQGFWKCMDALRDRLELDQLWSENQAPWKVWK